VATIAIVDDNAGVRSLCTRVLEAEGHQTTAFAEAASLLEQVKGHTPDVIILDLFLPPPDGLETLKTLRMVVPDVPVIVISGGATGYGAPEPFLAVAGHLGAVRTLTKPLSPQDLVQTVQDVLQA